MANTGAEAQSHDSELPAAEYSDEFKRFLVLFDTLVKDSSMWIEETPSSQLDWLPIDNPNVCYGDRVTKVTIRSLFIHQLVAMNVWVRELADCRDGAIISVANDPELAKKLGQRDLIEIAAEMHEANMRSLRSFTVAQANRPIRFPGEKSSWTVMGFLWAMYGHHAFHLGNIDIYVRQGNNTAPDLFTFEQRTMA